MFVFAFLAGVLFAPAAGAPAPRPAAGIRAELKRLSVTTALVFPSQALDEEPLWSRDGERLAVNEAGVWRVIDLHSIGLGPATWHGADRIAVVTSRPSVSTISDSEAERWRAWAHWDPREIKTRSGLRLALELRGLTTALVETALGASPRDLWVTDSETCHSLSISPDESLLAFKCEMNGAFVMAISSGR